MAKKSTKYLYDKDGNTKLLLGSVSMNPKMIQNNLIDIVCGNFYPQ